MITSASVMLRPDVVDDLQGQLGVVVGCNKNNLELTAMPAGGMVSAFLVRTYECRQREYAAGVAVIRAVEFLG